MAGTVDPVVGVAQALSVFISASAAAMIAPHLVVVIAGIAGGIMGLMSWRQCSVAEGIGYVMGMAALAWLMAGTAAEFAAVVWVSVDDKRIVTPAALGIGWVGHRWPAVGRWFGRLLKASAEAALGGKAK